MLFVQVRVIARIRLSEWEESPSTMENRSR